MSESSIEKYRGLEKVEATEDLSLLMPDEDEKMAGEGREEAITADNNMGASLLTQEEVDQMLGIVVGEVRKRELTAEKVARVWEKLSDLDKKFVNCPQEQFDSIIPEYEELHGRPKTLIITALRKLISNGDPRASMISREESEAAG